MARSRNDLEAHYSIKTTMSAFARIAMLSRLEEKRAQEQPLSAADKEAKAVERIQAELSDSRDKSAAGPLSTPPKLAVSGGADASGRRSLAGPGGGLATPGPVGVAVAASGSGRRSRSALGSAFDAGPGPGSPPLQQPRRSSSASVAAPVALGATVTDDGSVVDDDSTEDYMSDDARDDAMVIAAAITLPYARIAPPQAAAVSPPPMLRGIQLQQAQAAAPAAAALAQPGAIAMAAKHSHGLIDLMARLAVVAEKQSEAAWGGLRVAEEARFDDEYAFARAAALAADAAGPGANPIDPKVNVHDAARAGQAVLNDVCASLTEAVRRYDTLVTVRDNLLDSLTRSREAAEASARKQEQVRRDVEATEGQIAASRARCAMFKHIADRTSGGVRALRTSIERVRRELDAMRLDVHRLGVIEASVINTAADARAQAAEQARLHAAALKLQQAKLDAVEATRRSVESASVMDFAFFSKAGRTKQREATRDVLASAVRMTQLCFSAKARLLGRMRLQLTDGREKEPVCACVCVCARALHPRVSVHVLSSPSERVTYASLLLLLLLLLAAGTRVCGDVFRSRNCAPPPR